MTRQHVNPGFLHSELTDCIIGVFYDAYDELGFGFLEANYLRALEVLLQTAGIAVEREVGVEVRFRGVTLGSYRLDMVVDDRVIVEVKASQFLAPAAERQLMNYLRATKYEVGLLLHFGPKPQVRRFLFTNDRKATACTDDADTK